MLVVLLCVWHTSSEYPLAVSTTFSHFTYKESEVQRGPLACLRSHSTYLERELGLEAFGYEPHAPVCLPSCFGTLNPTKMLFFFRQESVYCHG